METAKDYVFVVYYKVHAFAIRCCPTQKLKSSMKSRSEQSDLAGLGATGLSPAGFSLVLREDGASRAPPLTTARAFGLATSRVRRCRARPLWCVTWLDGLSPKSPKSSAATGAGAAFTGAGDGAETGRES